VLCSSSSACLAIAGNDYPRGVGGFGETWNGLHWTVRTVPDGKAADDLEGVACRSAQWCVAVGSKASGNGFVPVADRWNGAAWKIQPLPAPPGGGLLHAVACPAPSACRAVGSDDKGLFSEVWNGAAWVIRPVPVPAGGSFAGLNGVSCTAAASCEAVGSYEKDGTFRSLAEVWTGSRWLLQAPSAGPGATSSQLNAVSCVSATDCEAAGNAQTMATGQAGGVAGQLAEGLLEQVLGHVAPAREAQQEPQDAPAVPRVHRVERGRVAATQGVDQGLLGGVAQGPAPMNARPGGV